MDKKNSVLSILESTEYGFYVEEASCYKRYSEFVDVNKFRRKRMLTGFTIKKPLSYYRVIGFMIKEKTLTYK